MTEDPALLDAQARELYTRGDLAGALRLFEEALRIRAARISTHPNDLQNLEEWARSSICYGVVLNDLGRFDDALKAYEVSLPVYRQLLESDPANAHCLEDLFVCCTDIAGVLRQLSRPEAKEWWQRARLAREAILQYGRQLPAQSEKEFQEMQPTLGDAPDSPSKGPNAGPTPAPQPT